MDHEMSDYYDREDQNAEFRAAHEAEVCPECHFAGGLHNEGACPRWREECDESFLDDNEGIGVDA